MKRIAKISAYFIVATVVFYFAISFDYSSLLFKKAAAPVPDVSMEERHSMEKYNRDIKSPIKMDDPVDWLNWFIASGLSLVTYIGKRTVDLFYLKKEEQIKKEINNS